MSLQPSLPEHPTLRAIAQELDKTRGAAALHDAENNLVWVSAELKQIMSEDDEEKLGYGKHVLQAYLSDTWTAHVSPDSAMHMIMDHLGHLLHDTPGGKERLKVIMLDALAHAGDHCIPGISPDEISPDAIAQIVDSLEPVEPPKALTAGTIDFVQGDLPPMSVTELHVRLSDPEGNFAGTVCFYEPDLPARVLALLSRGDEGMYTRMADLIEPGRHHAAILFADLQGSALLSRRLPSAAYFKLIRAITSAVDEVVIEYHGIVGKHAGDGVTAFFLADDVGTSSGAARCAIEAARRIGSAAATAAKEVGEETGLIEASDCLVNVGLHWSPTLYMGQLVTGGRLEVTALGDEVNECARVQQAAREGEILASKPLVEHLEPEDAGAIRIDPDAVIYRTLAELPAAPDKTVRDAGSLPVTVLQASS